MTHTEDPWSVLFEGWEPPGSITRSTTCPEPHQDQQQNPSSDLSRTGPGQPGQAAPVPLHPGLSPSPRPYEIGTGTVRTAPVPDTTADDTHWEKVHPKIKTVLTTCKPRCITCHQPEGRGTCTPRCATICACSIKEKPPKRNGRRARTRRTADVCLVRTRAQAELVIGRDGYRKLIVRECPHCLAAHIHTAHPEASPYRRSGCGQPYVLDIA